MGRWSRHWDLFVSADSVASFAACERDGDRATTRRRLNLIA